MGERLDKVLQAITLEEITKCELEIERKYREYKPKFLYPENLEQLKSELNEFEKCFWRSERFEPDDHPNLFSPDKEHMGMGERIVYHKMEGYFPYRVMWNRVEGTIDGGLLGLLQIIRDEHKTTDVPAYVRYTAAHN